MPKKNYKSEDGESLHLDVCDDPRGVCSGVGVLPTPDSQVGAAVPPNLDRVMEGDSLQEGTPSLH